MPTIGIFKSHDGVAPDDEVVGIFPRNAPRLGDGEVGGGSPRVRFRKGIFVQISGYYPETLDKGL